MMKKNEQISARKLLDSHSWLGQLWRDERGALVTTDGAIGIAGTIAVASAVWGAVSPEFTAASATVMGNLKSAVGTPSPAQGAASAAGRSP